MSSENTHYSTVRKQDSTRFIVEDSIVLVIEPQISLNLKSVPVGLTMYLVKAGCQNSRQSQSVAHRSLAPLLQMLQGHLMAPIQLYSITMFVKKLLVGHTRSISGSILRGGDFGLTASSFLLKRSVVCDKLRFCVHHLVVYQYYSPGPSLWAPHDANPLLNAPE